MLLILIYNCKRNRPIYICNFISVMKLMCVLYMKLVVLVGVRKLMDLLFSQRDLFWLDNLLPEETRRKQEDVTKASSDGKIEVAYNQFFFKYIRHIFG